jgi:predicted transposase YbfD/YdcC
MHCQRAVAGQVIAPGGDYVLAIKGNPGTLYEDVRPVLDASPSLPVATHTTVAKEQGHLETRTRVVSEELSWLQEQHDGPGRAALGKVTRMREINSQTSTETAYYLLSRPLSAERWGQIVRQHWSMEHSRHGVREVGMNQDQARHRKDHGPENRALLRRLALNVARRESSKGSLKGKRKRAGGDHAYLTQLLCQFALPQMQ